MGFFKNLKNAVRSKALTQGQPTMSISDNSRTVGRININPPRSVTLPRTTMPLPRPRNRLIPGRFSSLPQIIPERMPSPSPTPRFFGGGLRSIFAGLPQFMGRFEEQRARERMSPPLPRAPLPMPMTEMPLGRPGFAEGEEVDINMLIADQGAREGISPAEQRAAMIKKTAMDAGLKMTNATANAFGLGAISFEEAMDKARGSNMDFSMADTIDEIVVTGKMPDKTSTMERNLRQQEQIFFPEKEKSFRDFQRVFKGGRLGDFLSYVPDQMQVADYMNYKREQDARMKAIVKDSLDDILEDLEKKN